MEEWHFSTVYIWTNSSVHDVQCAFLYSRTALSVNCCTVYIINFFTFSEMI